MKNECDELAKQNGNADPIWPWALKTICRELTRRSKQRYSLIAR